MRNDELLYHDLAVYIFNNFATRNEILCHDKLTHKD